MEERNDASWQLSSAVNKFIFHVAVTPWPPQADRPITLTFKNGPPLCRIRCHSSLGELPLTPAYESSATWFCQARTMMPAGPIALVFTLDWDGPAREPDRCLGWWPFEVRSDGVVAIPDVIYDDATAPDPRRLQRGLAARSGPRGAPPPEADVPF